MTALTATDVAAGWLMVGAVLILAGVGVIWFVRSEWAERRAERAHQADLERRLTAIPSTEWEQYVADMIRKAERAAFSSQRDGGA